MEKKYSISRYEIYRDHSGNPTSIFLAVSVNNETDGTTLEHWLSGEEKDLVLADEANLKPILEKLYAEAELKMENEVATRPMPALCPLNDKVGEQTKKECLEALVDKANIVTAKVFIVSEKVRVEEERLQAIENAKSPLPMEEIE